MLGEDERAVIPEDSDGNQRHLPLRTESKEGEEFRGMLWCKGFCIRACHRPPQVSHGYWERFPSVGP